MDWPEWTAKNIFRILDINNRKTSEFEELSEDEFELILNYIELGLALKGEIPLRWSDPQEDMVKEKATALALFWIAVANVQA